MVNLRVFDVTAQRNVGNDKASSRSAFATHLRLEAAATMCLREPKNPALSLESGVVALRDGPVRSLFLGVLPLVG